MFWKENLMIVKKQKTLINKNIGLEKSVELLAKIEDSENLFLSITTPLKNPYRELQSLVRMVLEAQRVLGKEFRQGVLELIQHLERVFKEIEPQKDRCMAIFLREGNNPIQVVIDLPGTIEQKVHLDFYPMIFDLIEKKDVYHRYAVVTLSKLSAHIFQVNAGVITKKLMSENLEKKAKVSRKISKERYVNHQKDRGMRFMKEKIRILDSIIRDTGLDHIILAGDPGLTSMLREQLPVHLKEKVLDRTLDKIHHSFEDILKDSIEAFVEEEDKESQEVMERLQHALATGGLAVAGYESVCQALRDFRLDKLIVSKECPNELIEPIVREAVNQNLSIETVSDSEILSLYEGFAGFTRYNSN